MLGKEWIGGKAMKKGNGANFHGKNEPLERIGGVHRGDEGGVPAATSRGCGPNAGLVVNAELHDTESDKPCSLSKLQKCIHYEEPHAEAREGKVCGLASRRNMDHAKPFIWQCLHLQLLDADCHRFGT